MAKLPGWLKKIIQALLALLLKESENWDDQGRPIKKK